MEEMHNCILVLSAFMRERHALQMTKPSERLGQSCGFFCKTMLHDFVMLALGSAMMDAFLESAEAC